MKRLWSIQPPRSPAAQARFGPIHTLFNNAAVFDMAPLLESSEASYDKLFAVNVKGMFFVMQAVLRHMVDAGTPGASIINMASQAGRRGEADGPRPASGRSADHWAWRCSVPLPSAWRCRCCMASPASVTAATRS